MNTNPDQTPVAAIATPAATPQRKPLPNYAALSASFREFLNENVRFAAALLLLPMIFVTYPIFAGLLWQWTPATEIETLMLLADARFTYLCTSELGMLWLGAAVILFVSRSLYRLFFG